jgi:hypothetical protein
MSSTARLVERIREEYAAMPGLKLTGEQACRLWGVGHDTCKAALDALLAEGFLHRTGTGKYIALPRAGATPYVQADTARPAASASILRCPHCGKKNTVDQPPPAREIRPGHAYEPQLTFRCEGCQRVISVGRRSA